MGKKSSVSVLCFFIISVSAISVSAQEQTCNATDGMFKPNSSYDNNRRLVLSTLPSNVTAHDGYFNGSTGLGPDRVYAMGMCAPGAKPDACTSCINGAARNLLQICLNQTNAFLWLGEEIHCLVRYSNRSFSGLLVLKPYQVYFNYMDIEKNDRKEFDSAWDGFMARTITRASSSVRNNSSNSSLSSSSKYYAKDVAPVPVYGDISVLMHCTPDVSSQDCKLCLESSVDYYKRWYPGKRGVIILRPSCFFRWELYRFSGAFDSATNVTSPPPSPPSSVTNQTNTTKKDKRISGGIVAAIVIVIVVAIILIALGIIIFKRRKQNKANTLQTESVKFDLKTIEVATSNFAESNKLGEGGFGDVYKGVLPDGTEVAVKRLSKTSGQGAEEFKNEAVLVTKLQHRNLVRLLGFCLEGEEKILVYEFVPNKSLDYFLFDPVKQGELDWTRRYNIIKGIARGLLYLHQDSRLTIIHRDLKASNILLDADMNPKIADFGMARRFEVDQSHANTRRIVGTYGYMSPEYAMRGHFSMKSDVYSFGILILEVISGKKISSSYHIDDDSSNLVTHAWRLWRNGSPLELVDPTIEESYDSDEAIRCIHIALLCVQENPADRPTLPAIILMLTSITTFLPVPRAPGFCLSSVSDVTSRTITGSINDLTVTGLDPR
uniref:Cysteine-rich receptor-like protein kinase 17 n=2 Tax=Noccaea caerulescens TaxID=107243 RepID=A0A1J3G1P3_NOCCA